MSEKPILFSGPMVRAILEGRKTMTRRVIKGIALEWLAPDMFAPEFVANPENHLCPYGQPGDRLWVRETWGVGCRPDPREGWVDGIEYRADQEYLDEIEDLPLYPVNPPEGVEIDDYVSKGWRPSIFMPRWASRITLELTAVRVERVQDISEADAKSEGIKEYDNHTFGLDDPSCCMGPTASVAFRRLWDSINAKRGYGWDANPWVGVVEFKKVEPCD